MVYSDLMNIESSRKFTRSGDTASGCIEGVNLEDYQVGVVGGRLLKSGMWIFAIVNNRVFHCAHCVVDVSPIDIYPVIGMVYIL